MMNIDEVIKNEENIADACKEQANMRDLNDPYAKKVAYKNGKCAEMHKQIAEWLKELKKLKKLACCEDCVSRKAVLDLINADWEYEGLEVDINNLPSVKPVACIGTVKFSKEAMQELVDEKVKELVLENVR